MRSILSFYLAVIVVGLLCWNYAPKFIANPVLSLTGNSAERQLFQLFIENSIKPQRIFVDFDGSNELVKDAFVQVLNKSGYQKATLTNAMLPGADDFIAKLPMVPLESLGDRLSKSAVRSRAKLLSKKIRQPFSGGLNDAVVDPLGLRGLLYAQPTANSSQSTAVNIAAFDRTGTQDFEAIAPVYQFLENNRDVLKGIGNDLFAFENYRVIKDDLYTVSLLSIPLSLLLFFGFCRSVLPVGFLLLGSAISLLTGLGFARLFYFEIYGIVLAFASTLVGFNNEYLAHLSGIPINKWKDELVGLGSAIGTTVIAFLFLLFSGSDLFMQLAVVCIGGCLGFVLFCFVHRRWLSKLQYRRVSVPSVTIYGWPKLIAFLVFALAALWGFRLPLKTDINQFRYISSLMSEQEAHFRSAAAGVIGHSATVFKIKNSKIDENCAELRSLENLEVIGNFQCIKQQQKSMQFLKENLAPSYAAFYSELKRLGIDVNPPALDLSRPQSNRFGEWVDMKYSEGSLLVAPSSSEASMVVIKTAAGRSVMNRLGAQKVGSPEPVSFYNGILSRTQSRMMILILIGTLVMFAYLVPIQRSIYKSAAILLPFVLAFAAILLALRLAGAESLSFVHGAGVFFILAVALDYSALSLSKNYDATVISKLALTGALTLTGFVALCFADHPVIKSLGLVVSVGVFVSWISAVCIRWKLKEKKLVHS